MASNTLKVLFEGWFRVSCNVGWFRVTCDVCGEGKEQGNAYEGPHKDRNMDVCGILRNLWKSVI